MPTLHTALFGAIPLDADGAYLPNVPTGSVKTRGECSLFLNDSLSQAQLDAAAPLVDALATLDERAREAIAVEDDDVGGYIAFHLEELAPSTLAELFGRAPAAIDRATFLAGLDLVGIGIHPADDGDVRVVLDYSLGRAHSDALLAVTFAGDGLVRSVSHES